jgi:hypothetical protein
MADLISLSRFKATQPGINNPDLPDAKDIQYGAAIAAASALIRSYTGMEFNVVSASAAPAIRQFEYDGSGWLDVGEAQDITLIRQQGDYFGAQPWTIDEYQWTAYPLNSTVKRWLRMPLSVYGISPEMGFTYNLDTLAAKYGYDVPSIVSVTARWGWPSIPADVQQAVVWTAQSMLDSGGGDYQSQTIASYSRTKAYAQVISDDPIPAKARAALQPYIMPNI